MLKIPPEKRWRFQLYADELKDLCSDAKREEILGVIIERIKGKTKVSRKTRLRGSAGPELRQTTLEALNSAVSPAHCPVTGYGCNKSLVQYLVQQGRLKAFLAVPFGEQSWVYDARQWIKNHLSDDFGIRCVDGDDFPAVGHILCKICSCVRQMPVGVFEITELNPNVIFELGMATALNRLNFMMVYEEKAKLTSDAFPLPPLVGMEYVPYGLSENSVFGSLRDKVFPAIRDAAKAQTAGWCWTIRASCPHGREEVRARSVFAALPFERNIQFFEEVEKLLRSTLRTREVTIFKPAKSVGELCQMCRQIRRSEYCIVDTTYNDATMLFALGLAFGLDKQFVQLHDTQLSPERPISDIRRWAIEYGNLAALKSIFRDELRKLAWL